MENFIIIFIGLLGWGMGLVLNYLADVLPVFRKLTQTQCTKCNERIDWKEYISGTACGHCGQRRPIRFWVVQILTATIFMLVWHWPPIRLGFWLSIFLFSFFGLIAIIDIEHRLILNPTSIAGIFILLPIGIIWNGWISTLIGGAAGFGIMLAIFGLGILFNRLISRMRGQTIEEEALGFGDVNLAGILGLLLGWPKIGIGLFFAIFLAGIVSGFILIGKLLTRTYQAFAPIPYAPFLLISATVMVYLYK